MTNALVRQNKSRFPAVSLLAYNESINLPGTTYKYKLPKDFVLEKVFAPCKASNLFKSNFVIKNLGVLGSDGTPIDNDCFQTVQNFHKSVSGNLTKFDPVVSHQDPNPEKMISQESPLYIALITHKQGNKPNDWLYGTVVKIQSCVVQSDEKHVLLTFKSMARIKGRVSLNFEVKKTDSLFILNDVIFEEQITSEKWVGVEKWKSKLTNTVKETDRLIKVFVENYEKSVKSTNSNNFYLLSPLNNILYVYFTKLFFKSAWAAALKLVNNSNKYEVYASPDILISILPTPRSQKLTFLQKFLLEEKLDFCVRLMQKNFNFLLESLNELNEYTKSNYLALTQSEKARVIAAQLKSLKICLEDLKLLPGSKKTENANYGNGPFLSEENEDSGELDDIRVFLKKMPELNVHFEGQQLLERDFKRLVKMNPQSAEYQQLRNYFDNVMDIPFSRYDELPAHSEFDLAKAKAVLDEDHYGLTKVKTRLMEYLCIHNILLNKNFGQKGRDMEIQNASPTILLLDGPPGVGKTSIAKSIAKVLQRSFQRISLGGIYNESDIRGHRRTYVGSMNGAIINALKKAQSMNPVILLDELDKMFTGVNGNMVSSNNGNPSAALLEVLDPQQNSTFTDHYVGFPVDLSQVVFICTSNDCQNIPAPLMDRMEVIQLSGYLFDEKKQIALRHLLPMQVRLNGLDRLENFQKLDITEQAWESLIWNYTHEAGVRGLNRLLGAIVRSCVIQQAQYNDLKTSGTITIDKKYLLKLFGETQDYDSQVGEQPLQNDKLGIVRGLSYNSNGTGSVLTFEIIKIGEISTETGPLITHTTGNLGNVLLESITIGCSIVKNLMLFGAIDKNADFLKSEYHLHVPEGAVSKDGPSAGMAITVALLSYALNKPVLKTFCMTGEITLQGNILPIGGLREKLYGAAMNGMKTVLVPLQNKGDLRNFCVDNAWSSAELYNLSKDDHGELPVIEKELGLQLYYVSTIHDAITLIWEENPTTPYKSQTNGKLPQHLIPSML
ncbi:hypothetical protein ACO0QE_003591 [Hanseniaspora vineae]